MSDSPSSSYYDPPEQIEVNRETDIAGKGYHCVGSSACQDMAETEFEVNGVLIDLCRWHYADLFEVYRELIDQERRSWADCKAKEAAREARRGAA